MIFKACFPVMIWMIAATAAGIEDRTLFSFEKPKAAQAWRAVNDGVMGGRSEGRLKINDDQNLVFFGTLSLENNGGFASIRATSDKLQLDADETVVLKVRGDGREYNLNLYTQANLGGYSYRQSFQTRKDEWVEVRLPMKKFVATWRGRTFPDQRLDANAVKGVGFLLGDKQPGPFQLEIAWIKAVGPAE